MENFRFHFTPQGPVSNTDADMVYAEPVPQRSLPSQMMPLWPPQTKVDSPTARSTVSSSPDTQMVLHQSRRRRASREPSPDLEKGSPASGSERWRPVRLQGYSEDPMKDEVIRGQAEAIKTLQAEIRNLKEHNQRAGEVETALRQERAKAGRGQEELIEGLRRELDALRPISSQEWKAAEVVRRHTENSSNSGTAPSRRDNIDLVQVMDTQQEGPSNLHIIQREITMAGGQGNWGERTLEEVAPSVSTSTLQYDSDERRPREASPALPLSFKRARGRHRPRGTIPITPIPLAKPFHGTTASSAPTAPSNRDDPVASLEAKVDLIMSSLGIRGGGHQLPHQRRRGQGEFRTPRPKMSKADGRNERLTWVRNLLQSLLGIEQDRDILNSRETLYVENTPLKCRMANFEKGGEDAGPTTLMPMQVNWDVIYGRWNEKLFGLFLNHCEDQDHPGRLLTIDDEDEISDIFFKRLERIQGIINEYRPKRNETLEQADKRYSDRHLKKLSVARRNRRRGELFNTRCDINMDHLPEDVGSVDLADEATKRWIDRYRINEAFGIEGTSSDGTDPYDSDAYFVHSLRWRNKDLAKKMRGTDASRPTTNVYGNNRPGNRPRTRKRRSGDEPTESVRKIPSGLPINCYDHAWYEGLTLKMKRDLCAKPALQLLADWDSD